MFWLDLFHTQMDDSVESEIRLHMADMSGNNPLLHATERHVSLIELKEEISNGRSEFDKLS